MCSVFGRCVEGCAGVRLAAPGAGRDMAAWLCWLEGSHARGTSALLSDSTARTAHANLAGRAQQRSKASATRQPAARKIETGLGLNTEHMAQARPVALSQGLTAATLRWVSLATNDFK